MRKMLILVLVVIIIAIPLNQSLTSKNINNIVILTLFFCAIWLLTFNYNTSHVLIGCINFSYYHIIFITVILISSACCLINKNLSELESKDYNILILFSILGAIITLSAIDILTLFLGLELLGFGIYSIIAIIIGKKIAKAGIKYFLLSALASSFVLFGIAIIYSHSATLNLSYIINIIQISTPVQIGIYFILTGIFFKLNVVPIHTWAVDIYDSSKNIVTIYLIIVPKVAYIGIVLILINICHDTTLAFFASSLSVIVGSLGGINRDRIKQILTYSTITHVGFIIIVLICNTIDSKSVLSFYLIQYTLTNTAIFIALLLFGEIQFINCLNGLWFKYPLITISITIILLSIAGVPPAIGFFAKYKVFEILLVNELYFSLLLGIFASVVSAFFYIQIIKIMFFINPYSRLLIRFTPTQCYFISVFILYAFIIHLLNPNLILNLSLLISLSLIT